ncbi:unnamed protein product [Gadus morhua 'NCC']
MRSLLLQSVGYRSGVRTLLQDPRVSTQRSSDGSFSQLNASIRGRGAASERAYVLHPGGGGGPPPDTGLAGRGARWTGRSLSVAPLLCGAGSRQ